MSTSFSKRARTSLAVASLLAPGCGAPEPPAPRAPGPGPAAEAPGITLPRARILLDAPAAPTLIAERAGVRLHLEGRARIAVGPDGRLARARALLPRGQARAVELPDRLGGGWVFAVVGPTGSQLFRAPEWTAELLPLVSTPSVVDLEEPIVAGFDRLYVRIKSQNLLVPIDPRTGKSGGLGPLPPASAYGAMLFADGWRAVVETDLRGLLATFDAGATWIRVPDVGGPVHLSVLDGDPTLTTSTGRWALRGDGRLSPIAAEPIPERRPPAVPATGATPAETGPLGAVPLRAALEDGWPDAPGTAVVARRGALARVSLEDGRTVFLDPDAFPDSEATCHAVPLGRGVGFACGEAERGTSIYQLVRGRAADDAIALREVHRFATARRVVSSGNGALVISGACSDAPGEGEGGPLYCVRAVTGAVREVRLRGASGEERVAALADGRVAVVLPPSSDRGGQITVLSGEQATTVPMRFDAELALATPTKSPSSGRDRKGEGDAREGLDPMFRGTWLNGLQEIEKGVLGGWIEAGGPVAGYRLAVDGQVSLGEVVEEDAALLSGPFGLAFDAGGRAMETTDFGRTWVERDLLPIDLRARGVARACGPSGCALPGALRVGWGEPAAEDDLAVAEEPPPLPVALDNLAQRPLSLSCLVASGPHDGASGLAQPKPGSREMARRPTRPAPSGRAPRPSARPSGPAVDDIGESPTPTGWQPLRGQPPPALGPGETGFDAGQPFEQVAMRAYAWGTRAGWGRTGRWLVRFDDRFDPLGVRSTRPTATPWSVDTVAAEQFGVGNFSYATTWAASLDLGGHVAVASGCTGRPCALYLAEDGGALLPLRDAAGLGFARPSGPVAQVGRTTWFLGLGAAPTPGSDPLYLHRAEGGVVTRLAPLSRPQPPRWAAPTPVRLARRVRTDHVGVVSTVFAGPNDRRGRLLVVPVDAATGTFGEPEDLGRADLADRPVRACAAEDDGWLVDVPWDRPPAIVDVVGSSGAGGKGGPAARVSNIEARVRIDAGSFCVESFAGATDASLGAKGPAPRSPDGDGLTLAVTHRGTGERWALRCRAKP